MISEGLKKKSTLSISLLIFVTITAVGIKYRTELFQTLQKTDIKWLVAGLACYLINYLSRAYRIKVYSHHQLRLFPDALRITSLHGFASYFLPMRSGDLTLPALLNLYHGMPIKRGSRILLRARLLDILSLGLLLTGATLLSNPRIEQAWRFLFLCIGLLFIGLPYLLVTLIRRRKKWLSGKLRWIETDEEKEISYPFGQELLQSLTIWFWTGCTTFCVIRSLGIPLDFMDVWFFAAIQLPLQLLPVQGLANSGNHEAGWLITLNLLGVSQQKELSLTLASHIILVCYVTTLGAVATLLPRNKKRFIRQVRT